MKKKIILIYICTGMAVFLILFSLFGVIAYRDYSASYVKGNNMFSQMEKTVRATYLIDDKFSPAFRKNIKAFINFDSRLAAIMVKDYSGNPLYCYSRYPSKVNFKDATLIADRYYSMYQGPVNVTGSPALKLEVLYKTLDRNRLVYMVKCLIIYVLVLIIITTALFVFFSEEFFRKCARIIPAAKTRKKTPVIDEPKKKASVADYGFAESKYFEMTLTDTLSEASSLDRDLVLAEVQFSRKPDNNLWQITGEAIKNLFSSTELVFAGSKDRFHIIFPDRTLKEALRLTRNLFQEISLRTGEDVLYAGLTSRNGRLLSPGRLLSEADTALSKADDEENIVALETDPDRYREYISSKC